VGTDETLWDTFSSICDIGWCKGEGELELWPAVSVEELDRDGDDNTGGVDVELSGECTPLTW